MERRDFLSSLVIGAGALGGSGLGGSGLAGCGAALPHAPTLGGREADALARRLALGIAAVREEEAPVGAGAAAWSLRPASHERLFRTGLEALVVADVARSIPQGTLVQGELAERLRSALPILDTCALAYHDLLVSTPPAVRRSIDRHFRERPGTAMELAEWMDGGASRLNVSADSRLKLRSAALRVGTRIRRQSSGALVEETTSKVGSLIERGGVDLAALRVTTTSALLDGVWGEAVAATPWTRPASAYDSETPPPVHREGVPGPGDTELTAGGIMIGVGLGVFGLGTLIGWAAGSAMWGAIISATPGSILVILGLIFVIIGAVQNA